MLKTQIIYTIGFLLFSHSICLKFTKSSPNFTVSTKLGRDTSVIILRSPSTSKLLLLTSLYQSLNIIIYKMLKKYALREFVTEETIFAQSRCHWKALYYIYFIMCPWERLTEHILKCKLVSLRTQAVQCIVLQVKAYASINNYIGFWKKLTTHVIIR